jgi:hypothetical protein
MTAVPAQLRELIAEQPGERLPVLPVLPVFADLLPGGGLRRGCAVTVERSWMLCVALVAGASATGAWCAVVGMPQLGVLAAAQAGLDVGRLLLVPDPGPRWPQVVATLLEGCELVLLRPPSRPSAHVTRRLVAHARRNGSVLLIDRDVNKDVNRDADRDSGEEWTGAHLRLRLDRSAWVGIGAGHGRLRGRRVQVVASGRGIGGRPRTRWCWLPGPDGAAAAVDPGVPAGKVRHLPDRAERAAQAAQPERIGYGMEVAAGGG